VSKSYDFVGGGGVVVKFGIGLGTGDWADLVELIPDIGISRWKFLEMDVDIC